MDATTISGSLPDPSWMPCESLVRLSLQMNAWAAPDEGFEWAAYSIHYADEAYNNRKERHHGSWNFAVDVGSASAGDLAAGHVFASLKGEGIWHRHWMRASARPTPP